MQDQVRLICPEQYYHLTLCCCQLPLCPIYETLSIQKLDSIYPWPITYTFFFIIIIINLYIKDNIYILILEYLYIHKIS